MLFLHGTHLINTELHKENVLLLKSMIEFLNRFMISLTVLLINLIYRMVLFSFLETTKLSWKKQILKKVIG